MRIETVTTETFSIVLPLIAEYQRFYRTEPDTERNIAHFSQFLHDHSRGIQFLAFDDENQALGFATIYFPLSSLSAGQYCLRNDLFVAPNVRGGGVGRALIEHCLRYAKDHGYSKLHWSTELDNHRAQRLYDSLTS